MLHQCIVAGAASTSADTLSHVVIVSPETDLQTERAGARALGLLTTTAFTEPPAQRRFDSIPV
jgi:hypothetical protein